MPSEKDCPVDGKRLKRGPGRPGAPFFYVDDCFLILELTEDT